MKNSIISLTFIFAFVIAVNCSTKTVLEKQGTLIKATYYFENGTVQQQGFYKDGKPHGEWIAYNNQGKKIALGQYNAGVKVGKWFFWNQDILSEVDYNDSRIAAVNQWKNSQPLVSNNQ